MRLAVSHSGLSSTIALGSMLSYAPLQSLLKDNSSSVSNSPSPLKFSFITSHTRNFNHHLTRSNILNLTSYI